MIQVLCFWAKMILLASQKIGADNALDWGLVDRIVEPDSLVETVAELTSASLAGKPEVLREIKTMCAG